VANRWRKPLRILIGIVLMGMFRHCVPLRGDPLRRRLGVPYFSFTSERGSHCTNDFAGYTCEPVTLADVEFFGDVDLPEDSTIISGTYRSTHDYRLDAVLQVPAPHAAAALSGLHESFGKCQPGIPPR
jgi:hypothetical protein